MKSISMTSTQNNLERLDPLSPTERSKRMSLIRNKDTKPEMAVRRLVHSMGYRYRLHRKDLPGQPDLVFPGKRKVIFVHGCFWHRHPGCKNDRPPKTRAGFWLPKLKSNRRRDLSNQSKLRELGWDFLIIWECELKNDVNLNHSIIEFLGSRK